MPWLLSHKQCKCGSYHDFCEPDEILSMSGRYSYTCPVKGEDMELTPNSAATEVEKCPDDAVVISRVD